MYNSADDSEPCELEAVNYPSTICYNQLGNIRKEFHIPIRLGIMVASDGDRGLYTLEGWMTVYRNQIEAGLRLPVHNLFYNIMNYWRIEIGQIALNGIRIVVAFILLCKYFEVEQV